VAVIEQSIDVEVPIRVAYRQWLRFEEYPRFIEGVREVYRLSEGRLRWSATICGFDVSWDATLTEEIPDQKITWRSEGGLYHAGTVTLTPLGEERTRINLRIEYDPEDVLRIIGYKLGSEPGQVMNDLETFKELVEDLAEEARV
jgi:uncharacterized membrane protein